MSEDIAKISKVLSDMKKDLFNLGDVRKMLASPSLIEAMRDLMIEGATNVSAPAPSRTGTLYFRGAPVVECDHLQGMEYAFVK